MNSVVAKRRQAGDTIVEVLLAITVASSVLVGAYTVINHNTGTTQDTQEHSQALKYAQAQVEFLNLNNGINAGKLCFDSSGSPVPNANPDDCTIRPNGSGTDPAYKLKITQDGSTKLYDVNVNWDSLLGGQSNVDLYYRPMGS